MVAIDSQTNSVLGATSAMLGADLVQTDSMISVGAITQGIIVEQWPGATRVIYYADGASDAADNIVYVQVDGASGNLATYAYQLADATVPLDGLWDIPFSLFAAGLPPDTGGNGGNGGGTGGDDGGMDGMEVIEDVARSLPRGRSRQKDFRAGIKATCDVLDKISPFADVLPKRFAIAIDALSIACEVTSVLPEVASKIKRFTKALRPF